MKLPRKNTMIRKLIDALPKDKDITRLQLDDLMISLGYDKSTLESTIKNFIKREYLCRGAMGCSYRLTAGVLKNFLPPAPEPEVQRVSNFRPLKNYSLSHRDDNNRMRFITLSHGK